MAPVASGVHEMLLRGLAPGAVMWLRASGKSLWPIVKDGDSLRVERVSESQLQKGNVAVVKLPNGLLAAHWVIAVEPLETCSTAGLRDALPLEALGRVTGLRRHGVVWPWPLSSRWLFRWLPPAVQVLKRVPLARHLIRLLRDDGN